MQCYFFKSAIVTKWFTTVEVIFGAIAEAITIAGDLPFLEMLYLHLTEES
jgi:hypothetical protein